MPVGRSLVFSGSQAKNISYSIDHRHKIFRTLSITGKKYVFYRKDISVSTSWWEVANAWFFRITGKKYFVGPVAGSVGIEGGVVSGVINLESLDVRAPSRRPRHENRYHDA